MRKEGKEREMAGGMEGGRSRLLSCVIVSTYIPYQVEVFMAACRLGIE